MATYAIDISDDDIDAIVTSELLSLARALETDKEWGKLKDVISVLSLYAINADNIKYILRYEILDDNDRAAIDTILSSVFQD